jgi:hypothetical protein
VRRASRQGIWRLSLSYGREASLERIQDEYLVNVLYPEGDESQDAPCHIRGHEDIFGPRYCQHRGRGYLENGISDEVDSGHQVVVVALEANVLLHSANISAAIARPVHAEEEPYQREVRQEREVKLDEQGPVLRRRSPEERFDPGEWHRGDERVGSRSSRGIEVASMYCG